MNLDQQTFYRSSPYVRHVLGSPAMLDIPGELGPERSTMITGPVMQRMLAVTEVARDPARFVHEMDRSGFDFALGREAKMAIMSALGRAGAESTARRIAMSARESDNTRFLWHAYDAASRGLASSSYWALAEGVCAARESAPPSMSVDELVEKHPHLSALDGELWNVRAALTERPDLRLQLARPSDAPQRTAVDAAYLDIPEEALKRLAHAAVLLGCATLWVAPENEALARTLVEGSPVNVITTPPKSEHPMDLAIAAAYPTRDPRTPPKQWYIEGTLFPFSLQLVER